MRKRNDPMVEADCCNAKEVSNRVTNGNPRVILQPSGRLSPLLFKNHPFSPMRLLHFPFVSFVYDLSVTFNNLPEELYYLYGGTLAWFLLAELAGNKLKLSQRSPMECEWSTKSLRLAEHCQNCWDYCEFPRNCVRRKVMSLMVLRRSNASLPRCVHTDESERRSGGTSLLWTESAEATRVPPPVTTPDTSSICQPPRPFCRVTENTKWILG